jgi:hypothetical protein
MAGWALEQAGIDYDPAMLSDEAQICSFLSVQHQGQPEFDESFFQVQE